MKRFGQILRELWRDPMGRIGMLGIFLVILMAVFAPQLSHFGPEKMVGLPKAPPSSEFWFGTDNYGRDIFSRILYGARVSLQVGIIAVGIAATAGYVLGLIAGYFEGWVDRVIMCVMDIFFAFPSILLAIFISAVLGRGLVNTMIAIGIVNIPVFARDGPRLGHLRQGAGVCPERQVRGRQDRRDPDPPHLSQRRGPLHCSGYPGPLQRHSYRGVHELPGPGIQPPDPSWGSMLSEARTFMEQAPWMAVFPALFIIVTILLFNILGDSLRDVLDPKLKL